MVFACPNNTPLPCSKLQVASVKGTPTVPFRFCGAPLQNPPSPDRLSQLIPDSIPDLIKDARSRVADYLTPSVRLGVTGLARAGKTVFITALVRNLVSGGRLPFFTPDAEGRIVRAYLEPQPDDAVPRFDYETHMACLEADPPTWPESTRRLRTARDD